MSHAGPVYLDHAATTPMFPAAIEAMTAVLATVGNASSLHTAGRHARRRMEEARESIAARLGARPSEVIFTSGGTESDNLALKGIYWARRDKDPRRRRIITSAVEHHAVLDAIEWLVHHEGAEVTFLPTESDGSVTPSALRDVLRGNGLRDSGDVALVSVMWANNEVGTVQPIEDVVAAAAEYSVPVHSDAVQAVGSLPLDFAASGLDALSLAGHKCGGPFGTGALIVRRELKLTSLIHGGGQEREIRSGTLDTPSIAGFAAAVAYSTAHREDSASRLTGLREDLIRRVLDVVPDAISNGHPTDRLPGVAHLKFPGCEGDSLLMLLDARGIECSTGSACSAGVPQPSHVLLAMGCSAEYARSSLRFSLGHTSTAADVDALVDAIGPVVERARSSLLKSR